MNFGYGYRQPRNKYNAKKAVVNGEEFDSKKEARRYQQLQLMERAGEIADLQRQVKYVLIPAQREKSTAVFTKGKNKGQQKPGKVIESECSYYADFVYYDVNRNETIVEDAKGYRDGAAYRIFAIKRKLMLWRYGIRIREV